MKRQSLLPMLLATGLTLGVNGANSADASATDRALTLSPELLELLRAEMREIAGGVQRIAAALPTADWHAIEETGRQIRASYIMERSLSPQQAAELGDALPARFKHLDAGFHDRAEKLAAAAVARDAEQVVFHFSRLLEACTTCHSAFAQQRFPGFAGAAQAAHDH